MEGVRIYLGGDDVEVTSSHFLRPMRLTLSELRSLELGLAMLAQERPPEEHRAIEGARKRLRDAITKLPDADLECGWLDAAGPTGVDLDTIAQLRKAIRDRRIVRLNYQSGSATEPTWRDVHPLGLIFHSGMWYLVADGGGEYRFFRTDRMERVAVVGSTFSPQLDYSPDLMKDVAAPFRFPAADRLVIRYGSRIARWIAEREGKQMASDGTLTVEHDLGDDNWAIRFALQYGLEARVLIPGRIRSAIHERMSFVAST